MWQVGWFFDDHQLLLSPQLPPPCEHPQEKLVS
jgi:hypothetical protein